MTTNGRYFLKYDERLLISTFFSLLNWVPQKKLRIFISWIINSLLNNLITILYLKSLVQELYRIFFRTQSHDTIIKVTNTTHT